MSRIRTSLSTLALAALASLAGCGGEVAPPVAPERLQDTGLYADFATRTLAAGVLPFTPQYPLWTDGAHKRRWIALPAGTAIDASDPEQWDFPVGTRLWKEFAFDHAVETRFMQRHATGWLYATYLWSDNGRDARLAPEQGVVGACATAHGKRHDVPSLADCRACHENGQTPVLGFSALQLSPDRDPLAPHADAPRQDDVDLPGLVSRGLLRNLPSRWLSEPPRIAAASPRERAALGYLHGNCSSCHNAKSPLQRLGMRLDYPFTAELGAGEAPALATTLDVASQFVRDEAKTRIAPGAPERSVLWRRVSAEDAVTQMPPFGRHLADAEAAALIAAWIRDDLPGNGQVDTAQAALSSSKRGSGRGGSPVLGRR